MASDPQRPDPRPLDPHLLTLAGSRNLGALATVKRDGRPQLSNINFTLDPVAGADVRLLAVAFVFLPQKSGSCLTHSGNG